MAPSQEYKEESLKRRQPCFLSVLPSFSCSSQRHKYCQSPARGNSLNYNYLSLKGLFRGFFLVSLKFPTKSVHFPQMGNSNILP